MLNLVGWLFYVLTVYLEAEGEDDQGKLAVAYVIRNRAVRRGRSIVDTVLEPHQFSCWSTLSARRLVLDELVDAPLERAVRACAVAWWGLAPDPTGGSTHYLNPDVVLATAGRMPTWAAAPGDPTELDPAKVRARIGRHVFLVLEG